MEESEKDSGISASFTPPGGNDNQQQPPNGPVPLDRHYGVFKSVENKVQKQLNDLEHEYFVIGLRVAYDDLDSASEPGVLPFSVEFGNLGPVDLAGRCTEEEELGEEELAEAFKNSPIPREFLDELLETSKKELEAAAAMRLSVGVSVVLTGSAVQGYSIGCLCNNRTRKKYCYYDRTVKATRYYCTRIACLG